MLIEKQDVQQFLQVFLDASDPKHLSPKDWVRFYDFIVQAYQVTRDERPRISELSDLLKNYGFEDPGTLAVLYAHCLYVLARFESKQIYIDGFNP